jgi:F0F1-type ATP synthase membrane subunit a
MSSFIVESNKSPITENVPKPIDINLTELKQNFNFSNTNIVISVVILLVVIFIIYYFSTGKSQNDKKKSNIKNIMEVEVKKLRDFQTSLINTT